MLKPGGLVGVREEDNGATIVAPHDPIIDEALELYWRYWRHGGGDPFFARRHRQVLREAGFTRITVTASADCIGDSESTHSWGELAAQIWLEPVFADEVIGLGWADLQTLEKMVSALRAWGQHPDALFARLWCEAVAWKNA